MGIGMVLVVSPEAADRILVDVQKAYRIGQVISGKGVTYA
jgi:phosphoribosylformylglycinamidine cyclo-ligase